MREKRSRAGAGEERKGDANVCEKQTSGGGQEDDVGDSSGGDGCRDVRVPSRGTLRARGMKIMRSVCIAVLPME